MALAALLTCAALGAGVSACAGPVDEKITDPPLDTSAAAESCPAARPSFGGPATAEDRALFAYEATAPRNLQTTVDSTASGVEFNSISFDSPAGGSVPGLLYRPVGRSGLRPGAVVMHPSGNATAPVKGARLAQNEMASLAKRGAVVIGIDAPYFRRGGTNPPTLSALDRPEQIQLMKDLQRAVDVLLAEGNVDPARIGFSGYSYGGMVGVHFAGIERRLKAAVIMAGYGGSVTLLTTKDRVPGLPNISCAVRSTWFADNVPIEPIRFIPGAAPTALLFQIARFDTAVPLEDAQAVYDAASSPKEVLYYDTGHGLSPQATAERFAWLAKQIGTDP
jgi:dienelactone hydrolase